MRIKSTQIAKEKGGGDARGAEADDDLFVDAVADMLMEAERSYVTLSLK